VEQLEERTLPSVQLGTHVTGLTGAVNSFNVDPPDTIAAAGPNHVVELVNVAIEILSKTGSLISMMPLGTFFAPVSPGNLFDPVVLYDEAAGRWFIGVLDSPSPNLLGTPNNFDFAISNTSDPTGTYTMQKLAVGEGSFAADYPRLGVNADAYFVSFNMFVPGGPFDHPQILAIQKSTLTTFHHDQSNVLGTLTPANMHGAAAGGPEYFVTEAATANQIDVIKETNVLSNTPTDTDNNIAVTPYNQRPPPADQPGGKGTIRTNDSRMLSAAWRNNVLVATHTVGTGTPTTAHARWYQFDTSASTPTLSQFGEINPGSGVATYFPSIDIATNGDIGMTYMESSTTEFVSMYVTGRAPTDPTGTMETGVVSSVGTANYTPFPEGARAGDYSGTSVDPSNGTSFWSANEFINNSAPGAWATGIANFSVAGITLNPTSWTPIGPAPIVNGWNGTPASGRITALAASPTDPKTIYVATAGGGVWETVDGGVHWSPLTDNQSTLFMGAIAIAPNSPNVIYAGTGEATNSGLSFYGRGILKSTDFGQHWSLITGNAGKNEFDRRTIAQIVVSPTDPNTVYVAVDDRGVNGLQGNTGIWKTSNGGTTWTDTTSSISTTEQYTDLVINPTDPMNLFMAVGTFFGSSLNGVYETTTGGASWAPAGNFPGGSADGMIKIAMSGTTLYASIADPSSFGIKAIEKSTDGGVHWNVVATPPTLPNYTGSQAWYSDTLAVSPTNPNIVFAAGAAVNSVIESTDGGMTWNDISDPGTDGPHVDHHGIGFDANGKLLDGNDGGIWRLENPNPNTTAWTDLNGNLNISQFIGIALDPTNANIAYGGTQDNGTIKFTGSLGWNFSDGGDGGKVLVDFTTPTTVYHGFPIQSFFEFFQRSDNSGAPGSWNVKITGINSNDPMRFYQAYTMDPTNSHRLLFGTDRVYETTNQADNWTAISPAFTTSGNPDPIDSLAIAKSSPNTIYAAANGHIFVTFDDGTNWTERSIPNFQDHIKNLQVDPTNNMIVYAVRDRFNGAAGGHVFKSIDGGQNWMDISGDLPDIPTYVLALDSPSGRLFVGTDNGVYASTNGGTNWSVYGTGLPNVQVRDLELNQSLHILAAGTHGRGMWEIQVTVPNPKLTVTATNITGTEGMSFSGQVATIDDADATAPGNFTASIEWGDGTTSPGTISGTGTHFTVSGIHTYTEEGSFTVTIKVHDTPDNLDGSATSTGKIADPAVVATGAPTVTLVDESGGAQPFTLATFTDPGGPEAVGDYTASINWGDGSGTTTGTISLTSGVFTVTGSHLYAEEGSYSITITLHHDTATDATATTSVTITDPPVVGTGLSLTAVEATQTNQTVATFTDPGGAETLSHYSASIDWGDNSATTTGTISVTGGVFSVSGSHLYTEEGAYSIIITLHHDSAADASATTSVTVTDPSVVGTGFSLTTVENTQINQAVATFTDPAGAEALGDYSASIDWGDNSATTAGTISVTSGVFTVSGSHSYAKEGSYTVTVRLHHDTAADASATTSLTITDPSVVGTGGFSLTTVEGTQTNQTVATFTDPAGAEALGNYSASISWGDGATTNGGITFSAGTFTVKGAAGSHAYHEEGSYTITVVLHHGTAAPATVTSSANVSDAPVLAKGGFTASFVEGSSASSAVATFTDPGGIEASSDYSADINWGSGPTSAGTITFNNGVFTVRGSHNYAEEGSFTVAVTIHHDQTPSVVVTNKAIVADAPLTVIPAALSAVEGATVSGTIFSFTDANPNGTADEFTATIAWGDGTSSAGTITTGAGGFIISGSHTYAEEGPQTISATIHDAGGLTTTATSTLTVADATVVAIPAADLHPVEGASFNGTVASFIDQNPAGAAGDFTATIDWGDGTTSAGTITVAGTGFNVSAPHTYTQEGSYTISVTVLDKGGSGSTATTMAVVRDANVTAAGVAPITSVEAAPFGGVVATFNDANPFAQAGEYTVSIAWGDGQSSAGIVSGSAAGFQVSGQHLYAETGSYMIGVTIRDPGGSIAEAIGSAVATEAALQGAATPIISQSFSITNAAVATFTDPGGADSQADYAAAINWGDGTASQGNVVLVGNQFVVVGSHTFVVPGSLSLNVVVSEPGGNSLSLTSPEIVGTPNQRWLARVYTDLLGRTIDTSGLASWNGLLAQGVSRTQVVLGIQSSFEYHTKLVQSWYLTYLGRPADPVGLAGFVQLLSTMSGVGGDNVENFIKLQLISSQEYFFNRGGGTNLGFLQALFHDALGRDLDPGAAATLGLMLAQGTSRFQIAALVINGVEADQVLLERDYVRFLRRDVDPVGLQVWVNGLQHGLRETVLIADILGSEEYFAES
jgi:hypothetical protein